MDQLLDASKDAAESSKSKRQAWTSGIDEVKHQTAFYDDPEMHRDSSPVTPQRLVALLQQTLDPSTVFSLDAGNNRTWMAHLYQSRQANTFFCPGGTAGMGWGLPAAVALKLAYPDRPVACVTGDGGYMMTVKRAFHCHAVQPTHSMRCVQRQRPGHGAGPSAAGQDYRLGVRGHGQRRGRPRVRSFRGPGQRLSRPSPGPQGTPQHLVYLQWWTWLSTETPRPTTGGPTLAGPGRHKS